MLDEIIQQRTSEIFHVLEYEMKNEKHITIFVFIFKKNICGLQYCHRRVLSI